MHSLIALDQQQLRTLIEAVQKRLTSEPRPTKYSGGNTATDIRQKVESPIRLIDSVVIPFSDIFPQEILGKVPPPKMSPAQREAHLLFVQASQTNDVEESNKLLDQAIQIAEQAELPTFEYKLYRARSANPSEIIALYTEAADYYKQTGDIFRLLSSLRNMARLAHRAGNTEQALSFLDGQEFILSSLTPQNIAEIVRHSPVASTGDIETRLQAERVTLSRDRRSFSTR